MSVCLSVCLSVRPSVCLCVRLSIRHLVKNFKCVGTTPQPCDGQDQDAGLDAVKHSPAKAYSAMPREGRRERFEALQGEVKVGVKKLSDPHPSFCQGCKLASPAKLKEFASKPHISIPHGCIHLLGQSCVCVCQCLRVDMLEVCV